MAHTTINRKRFLSYSLQYWYVLVVLVCIGSSTASAEAVTMSNANYVLQMGNINTTSGKKSGSGFTLRDSVGQLGPGLSTGSNNTIKAGFQYISSIIPFSFRVSSQFIDFGTLSPANPVTRTQILTVSNGSANGYQVTISQDHNLRVNGSGAEIPGTACDSGPCTTTTAATWTSFLTYGLGYRCDNVSGTDCDSQFLPVNVYRPFAASPSAVMVMSSLNAGTNRQSTITYKVTVSNTQAPGLYGNFINFIATPTF